MKEQRMSRCSITSQNHVQKYEVAFGICSALSIIRKAKRNLSGEAGSQLSLLAAPIDNCSDGLMFMQWVAFHCDATRLQQLPKTWPLGLSELRKHFDTKLRCPLNSILACSPESWVGGDPATAWINFRFAFLGKSQSSEIVWNLFLPNMAAGRL